VTRKYLCGRCRQGFDDLEVFGEHPCPGENRALASLRRTFTIGGFRMDLAEMVDEAIEKQQLRDAVDGLEDHLRRGDLD
jgi:hypothetical protein